MKRICLFLANGFEEAGLCGCPSLGEKLDSFNNFLRRFHTARNAYLSREYRPNQKKMGFIQ